MAIAHLATEYVFSDFLLKEPTEPKFKGLRLELAVDKMVTCIAVGLPLLLISLAFAQEISIATPGLTQRNAPGSVHLIPQSLTQLSSLIRALWLLFLVFGRYSNKLFLPKFFLLASGCLRGFLLLGCRSAEGLPAEQCWKPSIVAAQVTGTSVLMNFMMRGFWMIVGTTLAAMTGAGILFFPYILLLLAILLYLPSLFWRFAAVPHLCSDLKFIMEELDKVYNRAIKAAKSVRDCDMRDGSYPVTAINDNVGQSLWEISESHFKYPIVEQYLKTKKNSNNLIVKYLSCRVLTLTITLLACVYLSYYFSLSSLSDEFVCSIKSGILRNDSTVPNQFQCKLIAVGIFQLLSFINLVVYVLLAPVVIYTLFVPFRQKADVLKVYEILPTFDVLHFKSEGYNDLSLYNLFLEENISELKSYKCLKILENIKSSGQGIDPMLLLTNLGMIKMDIVDGKTPKPVPSMMREEQENQTAELQDLSQHGETNANSGENNVRQRLMDSSC